MAEIDIRPITESDRSWVTSLVCELWSGDIVVTHGDIFHPGSLPGFIAHTCGEPYGLITYHLGDRECEIITLNSLLEMMGIGTRLVNAVIKVAASSGCQCVRVNTTNDNMRALLFYQKRGFRIVGIRPDAIVRARQIKPEIPLVGYDGIPIRDEIELKLTL